MDKVESDEELNCIQVTIQEEHMTYDHDGNIVKISLYVIGWLVDRNFTYTREYPDRQGLYTYSYAFTNHSDPERLFDGVFYFNKEDAEIATLFKLTFG